VQLAALARSDALTGAPNRRTWDHELSRACANSREQITPLCIAMIDMDHFKVYNDTHGHQAGDRLLREAVAAWTEQLGADAMIARYGGEEFAVLLPGVTVQEALARVRGMRPVTPDGQTFSAGVTAWDPQTEPGTAVAQADAALYQAKRTGRDRVLAHGYVLSGSDGGAALPPFTMVMQPIVDIATGAVVGHEALARFTDAAAGAGTDAAGAFRRAHADGHGDMLEAAAVTAALAVPDRPDDYDLYVNASAAALLSDRFWAELPTRLDGVVVELTEDQEHIDAVSLAGAVNRLRSRGGRIALDDLGAGVGEFSRLAALRPDVVKADRSLVHGCATHPGRSAVLRALVAYADDLGATVCAEGVEDAADLHHLAVLGVALAQGYLLSRPSPPWPTIAGCISAGAVAS
jgi:diguanylate cyclase (GGDEF)-like protein